MNKTVLPSHIQLKDININTNSETNGFNLLNINTKEINRVINLLLKRVFELGEEQDINNIISSIINILETSKKKFRLPFNLATTDLPLKIEYFTSIFEIRREDKLTYSISRVESDGSIEWNTSSIMCQVKTTDGIIANTSIITRTPLILIQFAMEPDEDHWAYII